ncbi:peptidoglycan glycosyltransferase [Fictibacillus macauensis ZFHKF-1]|uniref:Peptidoglycan glycosyltransferase n=1 Tax=Fictibacillus macauensis ZFHKF-1 TaxID=1196324 RepID=I8UDX0_9BACL|nr:PASTA domain-containing penicillin-binding protein [Fictibacillus macauensis]EIT84988.1 peptidoglycan glycosyltransferase [Fictibacillus macauensis ZFHKF-1]
MDKKFKFNWGAGTILLGFVLLFFILAGRFFYIAYGKQVQDVDLKAYAEHKWTRHKVLEATRGTIFDRNGNPIAEDIPSYTVIAVLDPKDPAHIKDPARAASQLAGVLAADESEIEKSLSKKGRYQVQLPGGRKISNKDKEKIEKMDIQGIDFIPETKRYYPNDNFASHVIGYTNEDNKNNISGVLGLEKTLDKYLKESNGSLTFKSDTKGIELPNPQEQMKKPKDGANVYLTLDEKIQTLLEQAMTKADDKYHPQAMIGIVADPKTGKILAMSDRPSFNPNKREIKDFTNTAISYPYEPGSTMKIFTLAAAIQEKVYNGNETYKSGQYKIPHNRPISDHNKVGWGTITFDEGVENSSNVLFSKLAREKLGYDRFYSYLKKFGLDRPTGIDLPNEKAGKILYNYEIEKLTTAFGQGTTVTPIQQIQGATAIANGGKMMRPFVINKVVDPSTKKTLLSHQPEVAGTPISEETAKQERNILEKVVTKGTGKPFQIKGYSVAGKTGTAQIVDKETGRYASGSGQNVFSFMGMAPKDDPKLLMYVGVIRPQLEAGQLGSAPVSDIFTSVMKNGLQYMEVEPDGTDKEQKEKDSSVMLSSFIGSNHEAVSKALEKAKMRPVVLGSGATIEAQLPEAKSNVLPGERVLLKTSGNVQMPDVTGWSKADVLKLAKMLNLKISVKGTGFANSQSLQKGMRLKANDDLAVTFAEPSMDDVDLSQNKKPKKEDRP